MCTAREGESGSARAARQPLAPPPPRPPSPASLSASGSVLSRTLSAFIAPPGLPRTRTRLLSISRKATAARATGPGSGPAGRAANGRRQPGSRRFPEAPESPGDASPQTSSRAGVAPTYRARGAQGRAGPESAPAGRRASPGSEAALPPGPSGLGRGGGPPDYAPCGFLGSRSGPGASAPSPGISSPQGPAPLTPAAGPDLGAPRPEPADLGPGAGGRRASPRASRPGDRWAEWGSQPPRRQPERGREYPQLGAQPALPAHQRSLRERPAPLGPLLLLCPGEEGFAPGGGFLGVPSHEQHV